MKPDRAKREPAALVRCGSPDPAACRTARVSAGWETSGPQGGRVRDLARTSKSAPEGPWSMARADCRSWDHRRAGNDQPMKEEQRALGDSSPPIRVRVSAVLSRESTLTCKPQTLRCRRASESFWSWARRRAPGVGGVAPGHRPVRPGQRPAAAAGAGPPQDHLHRPELPRPRRRERRADARRSRCSSASTRPP